MDRRILHRVGRLVEDCRIGDGSADWHWIDILAFDWGIDNGLVLYFSNGVGLMDWSRIVGLACDWQIGNGGLALTDRH